MTTLQHQLVAYAPGVVGARLGQLPEPLDWSATIGHSTTTGMSLAYSRDSVRGEILTRALTTGIEVAVEVWDGSAWVEPDGARFMVLRRRYDSKDQREATEQRVIYFDGVSLAGILSRARSANVAALLPEDHDEAGKRPFLSATTGNIVVTLLDEWAARNGYDFPRTFTTANDSTGVAWATQTTIYYAHLERVDVILDNLVDQGMCEYTTRGRELRIVNPAAALAPDLVATVRYELGPHMSEAPSEESIAEMVGRVFFAGGDGLYVTETDASVPSPWGVWEGGYSNQNVTTSGAATAYLQAELARAGRVRGQYTRDLVDVLPDGTARPLVDFGPGAWITAPGAGDPERLRVQQVVLRTDGDAVRTSLILNDVFVDADIRRARRQVGIVGGSTVGGGSNVRPRPPGADGRRPAAPTGVASTTDAYLVLDGRARALVALSWNAVTTAAVADGGGALEVAGYDVEWQYVGETRWRDGGRSNGTAYTVDDLDPSSDVAFRIRARGRTATGTGVWSAIHQTSTPAYVLPPPVPSTPIVSSRLGILNITWDGRTFNDTSMPVSFRRVEIAMTVSPSTNPPGTAVVDTLAAAGMRSIPGQGVGNTRYVRLRAVGVGGTSDWTPEVAHTITGIQGPDLEADNIWANSAFVGLARAELFRTGGIPRSALSFGTDELIPNNMWLDADQRALYEPASIPGITYNTSIPPRRLGQTHTLAFTGSTLNAGAELPVSGDITVTPGERVALEIIGYKTSSPNYAIQLALKVALVGGGTTYIGPSLSTAHPNGVHVTNSGAYTIPDGAVSAVAVVRHNPASSAPASGIWYVSSVSARKAMTSHTEVGAGFEISAMSIRGWDSSSVWFDVDTSNRTVTARGDFYARDAQGRGISMMYPRPGGGAWLRFDNDVVVAPYIASGGTSDNATERGTLTLVSGLTTANGWRGRLRLSPNGEFVLGGSPAGTQGGNQPYGIEGTSGSTLVLESNRSLGTVDAVTAGSLGFRVKTGGREATPVFTASGDRLTSSAVWSDTSTGTANMAIFSDLNGRIRRLTSLREHKVDIADADHDDLMRVALGLRIRTWIDKGARERGEKEHLLLGGVAQEVEELGVPWAVTYDDITGDLLGLPYDRFAFVSIALGRDNRRRIEEAEDWISAQQSELADLRARLATAGI